MTTEQLVDLALEFGRENAVDGLIQAGPYLEALKHAFGDREARGVTARELHAFHRDANPAATEPVLKALARKSQRWETIHAFRSHGALGRLPWETERPARPLAELFDTPGFQPRRVLELGCGDGVNALFMAGRGCDVTAIDISGSAVERARERQRGAGIEVTFQEGDVFELEPGGEPYDFIFDRGMFHHVQVFHYEDYKRLVADRLAPGGLFHLICHHVSDRPTVISDALCGSVGKLLSFLSGALVEAGAGFTDAELYEIFSDRFRIESIELVGDEHDRPFRFESALMRPAG